MADLAIALLTKLIINYVYYVSYTIQQNIIKVKMPKKKKKKLLKCQFYAYSRIK